MFRAFKAIVLLTVLALSVVGAGTTAAAVGLALELATMDQVVSVLQRGVDDIHYYLGGLTAWVGLIGTRYAVPWAWSLARSWLVAWIRDVMREAS